MTSTSDRKDVRRLEKLSIHRRTQDRETMISICETEAGRRWLWEKLSDAAVFTTTFSSDPLAMAFAEGQRNSGLKLLSQLQDACPEQFVTMMREADARRTSDTRDAAGDDDFVGHDPTSVDADPTDYA